MSNFKDFVGLPDDKNKRGLNNNNNYKLKLPIPRPNNSTRDQHPLCNKFKWEEILKHLNFFAPLLVII